MDVKIIAAMDSKGGTGLNGSIPWRCPEDLRRFRLLTMNQAVIVGRRTAEGLPLLKGRHVITLSRTTEGPMVASCMSDALLLAAELGVDTAWVAGGEEVWRAGIPYATEARVSLIRGDFGCDTSFPVEALIDEFTEREAFTARLLRFETFKQLHTYCCPRGL